MLTATVILFLEMYAIIAVGDNWWLAVFCSLQGPPSISFEEPTCLNTSTSNSTSTSALTAAAAFTWLHGSYMYEIITCSQTKYVMHGDNAFE